MIEKDILKPPYSPSLKVRLICWLVIYLPAASLYGLGRSVWPRDTIELLWYGVSRYPETLQLFIVGSLGLPYGKNSYVSILVLGYACYFLNLVLALVLPDKKKFWPLIALLAVLVFVGMYACSCYTSTVFEVIPDPQNPANSK
jgi:hypothetical protein